MKWQENEREQCVVTDTDGATSPGCLVCDKRWANNGFGITQASNEEPWMQVNMTGGRARTVHYD